MRSLAILSILTIVAAAPALASADGPHDGRRGQSQARSTRTSSYSGARQLSEGRGQQARNDRARPAQNDRARPARSTVTRPARDGYADDARNGYSSGTRTDRGQRDRMNQDRRDQQDRARRDREDRARRERDDRAQRDRNERRIAAARTIYYPPTYQSYVVPSGAIAYSPSTGQIGWSYGNTSLGDAESIAAARCGYGDCTVVAWEQGQYAAIAVGPGGAWGASSGLTMWSAEQQALAMCESNGAQCQVARWISR